MSKQFINKYLSVVILGAQAGVATSYFFDPTISTTELMIHSYINQVDLT